MGPKVSAAILLVAISAGAARAQAIDPTLGGPGNAAHGEVLFKQRCGVCHQPEPGGKNGVGPALYGAFGRKAAQTPGFPYSDKLKASGLVWTPEKLNQWIQKPASLVPGAKMVLAPVNQPQDRSDIIAYLQTKSTNAPPAPPAAKSPHAAPARKPHAHTNKS